MSDHWIVLVPRNPHFVPETEKSCLARERFAEMAPEAETIELVVEDTVQFYDCGQNFERVLCPHCRSEVPDDWWQERMEEDNEGGFNLAPYTLPCCDKESPLHQLVYDWPQAFGRFSLSAMNPDIGNLSDENRRELEEILGTSLTVIYQHH